MPPDSILIFALSITTAASMLAAFVFKVQLNAERFSHMQTERLLNNAQDSLAQRTAELLKIKEEIELRIHNQNDAVRVLNEQNEKMRTELADVLEKFPDRLNASLAKLLQNPHTR